MCVRTHGSRHMGRSSDWCLHWNVFGTDPTVLWVDLQMSSSVSLFSTAHVFVQVGILQFSF